MESPRYATPLYDTVYSSPLLRNPHALDSQIFDSTNSYTIFRSEISLVHTSSISPGYDVPDFFSLDIKGEDSEPLTPVQIKGDKPNVSGATTGTRSKNELSIGCFDRHSRFRSPMLQLHKEIVDFCDFLSPTAEEQALRNTAVSTVSSIVKHIWPKSKVEIFGSFRTGLYLPSSDIDIVILGSGIQCPQTGLQALAKAFSQKGIAKNIQVIAKARVPIIKFVEKISNVAFDISFDVANGPKAAEYIENVISKLPPLRPLCLILKVFLQQRELNEVYHGGIGSYALITMLIGMLKHLKTRKGFPEHNLGVLLIHFFDFFGRKLNTADVGISCNRSGTFFSKHDKGFLVKERPFLIAIEDPQSPDNDIGKNSFNYFQVKSAFMMALSTLTNPKAILKLCPERSILSTIIRPDPVLLDRKGGCSLLCAAGDPHEPPRDPYHDIFCNWRSCEEDVLEENGTHSSGKKRSTATEVNNGKKKAKKSKKLKSDSKQVNGPCKPKKSRKKTPSWSKIHVPHELETAC